MLVALNLMLDLQPQTLLTSPVDIDLPSILRWRAARRKQAIRTGIHSPLPKKHRWLSKWQLPLQFALWAIAGRRAVGRMTGNAGIGGGSSVLVLYMLRHRRPATGRTPAGIEIQFF
jgi:hypothetical protein